MNAPSARNIVVAAAVALTGTAAFGQQMANVNTDRAAHIAAQCGRIADPVRQAGCSAEASISFDRAREAAAKQTTATAEKSLAASQALRPCLLFLQEKRATGTVFDRTITRENACDYARQLGMRDPS